MRRQRVEQSGAGVGLGLPRRRARGRDKRSSRIARALAYTDAGQRVLETSHHRVLCPPEDTGGASGTLRRRRTERERTAPTTTFEDARRESRAPGLPDDASSRA